MSSLSVSANQSVSRGNQIGVMGSTGCSTGRHVHFAIGNSSCTNVSLGCTIWRGSDSPDGTAVSTSGSTGGSYPELDSGSTSANTFMVVNSSGAAYANNVLNAGMTRQTSDGDALKVAVGGNYMGLITSCGALYGKSSLGAGYTQMTACGDAQAVAVGSNGIYVVITGCGAAYSNRTISMSGWHALTVCGDATAISAGGQNIALINSGGTAYASTSWNGALSRVSNYGDAHAIAISSGGRLMMITGCGAAYANNAIGVSGWSQKAGCGDAVRIATGGSRLALINSGGTAYATDTWNGGMTQISNNGDATQISVGDTGTILMITGCGAAYANNAISVNNWYGLTVCGDAQTVAG
jgi:hypothetical protein